MGTLKNKVQLIGNVANPPEIVILDNGKKQARFFIATTESYRNEAGEKVTNTQWHSIVAWGKPAELVARHAFKGKYVGIAGKLSSHSYQDNEGVKHYVTEVICHELLLL